MPDAATVGAQRDGCSMPSMCILHASLRPAVRGPSAPGAADEIAEVLASHPVRKKRNAPRLVESISNRRDGVGAALALLCGVVCPPWSVVVAPSMRTSG